MSSTELLVIVFGLFLGYWVVAKLGTNKTTKEQSRSQQKPNSDSEFSREQAQRERQTEERNPTSWHEVLNVPSCADTAEIRLAYKRLMSQYHPDKVASLGPELKDLCERKTKEINSAYDQAMAERGAA